MTYNQAFNKIIEAYFRDEIRPLSNMFCFCGTLKGDSDWRSGDNNYSRDQYSKMENRLLGVFNVEPVCLNDNTKDPLYEEKIFAGMCAALEVLKEIHRSRGENVDEIETPFTKRNRTAVAQ